MSVYSDWAKSTGGVPWEGPVPTSASIPGGGVIKGLTGWSLGGTLEKPGLGSASSIWAAGLDPEMIKRQLKPYINVEGLTTGQLRGLAKDYSHLFVNIPKYNPPPNISPTQAANRTAPFHAIFNANITKPYSPPSATIPTPSNTTAPKLSPQTQQLAEAYNPLPTAPTFVRQRPASTSPFSLPKYYGTGTRSNYRNRIQ